MKTPYFKQLNELERKALLCGAIIKRTGDKLPEKTLQFLVNSLDTSIQYKIKVLEDAKEFAKEVTLLELKEYGAYNNSPEYMGGTVETAECLVGEVCLGHLYKEECYIEGDTEKVTDPNFDVGEICVVCKTTKRDFTPLVNPDTGSEHWITHTLIIYIPDKKEPYKISEDVKNHLKILDGTGMAQINDIALYGSFQKLAYYCNRYSYSCWQKFLNDDKEYIPGEPCKKCYLNKPILFKTGEDECATTTICQFFRTLEF